MLRWDEARMNHIACAHWRSWKSKCLSWIRNSMFGWLVGWSFDVYYTTILEWRIEVKSWAPPCLKHKWSVASLLDSMSGDTLHTMDGNLKLDNLTFYYTTANDITSSSSGTHIHTCTTVNEH